MVESISLPPPRVTAGPSFLERKREEEEGGGRGRRKREEEDIGGDFSSARRGNTDGCGKVCVWVQKVGWKVQGRF